MTAEELIKEIESRNLQEQFFDKDNWERLEDELEPFDWDEKKYLESIGLPTEYNEVAGRCDTSEFWTVIHFTNEDIYLRISGTYDSYGHGEHYYNKKVKQVFPKEVKQTIYK